MADRYNSFHDLAAGEIEGIDFRICMTTRDSPIAIIAPHGGSIETGTSEIAAAIAGSEFSLYCFEGLRAGRPHGDLHITSSRFDEPRGLQLVGAAEFVIAIHGRKDRDEPADVWLGGLDIDTSDAIEGRLKKAGFEVRATKHVLPGKEPDNICNRGRRRKGVQLELPRTLRNEILDDGGRLRDFATAIQEALS